VDRRDGPYTPGSGRTPGYLADRDPDLEEFQVLTHRVSRGLGERSIIYSGLRYGTADTRPAVGGRVSGFLCSGGAV
jgi:hypothetical protein